MSSVLQHEVTHATSMPSAADTARQPFAKQVCWWYFATYRHDAIIVVSETQNILLNKDANSML